MSRLLPITPELLARCRTGILFSAPMMLALLSGAKTVTRRMSRTWLRLGIGDLLYTRETWSPCDFMTGGNEREPPQDIAYRADLSALIYRIDGTRAKANVRDWNWDKLSWKPSIHQKRDYARVVLRVTMPTRFEHVQDITEDDAKREGVDASAFLPSCDGYRIAFRRTWERLHKKPGERWEDNPEIVRLAFERIA